MGLTCLKKIAIIIVCVFLFPSLLPAGFYKWVDEQGEVHFTDNYHNIPAKYRKEVSQSKYGREKGSKTLSKDTPQRVVVHFQGKGNAIFVNAILNWKLPVIFHLDTGATHTMIIRQDALALGIDPDSMPTMKGYIADGSIVEFPRMNLSSISVGDAEVNNVEVAIGSTRLLGMNFLNDFQMNIDNENGQLILERKDLVKESESPAVREEKTRTITELENQIEQIEITIEAKENIIKQIESDIQLSEEKRAKVEAILKDTKDSTRFEGSDISSDSGKRRKMKRLEENLARFDRHIEIKRGEIEMNRKQIEQLKERVIYCDRMIGKLG